MDKTIDNNTPLNGPENTSDFVTTPPFFSLPSIQTTIYAGLSDFEKTNFIIKALELDEPKLERKEGLLESEDEFYMVHKSVFTGKSRESLKAKLLELLLNE